MSDLGAWLIGLAFYAPIHYLGPLLVIVLTGAEDSVTRIRLIKMVAVECTVSMLFAFALAVWLFNDHPRSAISILVTAMFVPYLHVYRARVRTRRVAPPDTV